MDDPDRGTASLFAGSGEMAARLGAIDWAKTPIGPISGWSPTLKTMVRFLLANRFPLLLWWGPEYVQIYNDAYVPIPGRKHPRSAGQRAEECWSEIWHVIGPLIDTPFRGGPATWVDDLELEVHRHGFTEETHFTVAYSAVPDDEAPGGIGGVLATVHEITRQVVQERRVAALRDVGTRSAEARTADEACRLAAEALGRHPRDVPFALVYLLDAEREVARLAAAAGVEPGSGSAPATIDLCEAAGEETWPFAEVARTQKPRRVESIARWCDSLPRGPWADPPSEAIVLPIPSSVAHRLAGLLVLGLSARLEFDELYQSFCELAAAPVATAIANARAFEEEQRRAEALAELDRAKTAFFSNVSHEFRTPLTLMLGPLEDVLGAPGLAPAERGPLEVAHRNSLRLLRLVNTLLDFSRIEAGRAEASFERLDATQLTADLASAFRSTVERAGLAYDVQCAPIRSEVFLDREMWEKVVLNLLSNAFKFTFEGSVGLSLVEEDGHVVLRIRDTGVGIPRDELPRVFERFHRVRGTSGRTHEGTGIGLALVKELVKIHGGTVSVESVLGRGTTFAVKVPTGSAHLPSDRIEAKRRLASTSIGAATFVEEALRWLPDADAELPANASDARLESVASSEARVLVADDNADMRSYLSRLLEQHWRVEAVGDGEQALAAARRERPALIVSDVMMPRLDGVGLVRALRADPALRSLPVILVSARAGEECRVEGLGAGADDYLTKPFSARELLARVNARLEMTRMRQELVEVAERARTEAERANEAKDDFLAVLSHELRSPMNAMLGWLRILRSAGGRDPDLVGRAVDTLERNIWIQAQVISDLLDVSRIMTGKLELDQVRVDLASAVTGCVESLRPSAEGKQVALQLALEAEDVEVVGDGARLQQVISNLLGNAIKFTDAGGFITVTLERHAENARVIVADTGQGIDGSFLPHLFERFRQGSSSTARTHGGLGLGLAIVKHLVALHGGEIRAESEGLGRGARFVVTLPLAAGRQLLAPSAPAARVAERVESLALDVLIVEDDVDSLQALELALGQSGARVRGASSVRQALEEYNARPPDVLISDIGMPGEDGYVLIRAVREREEGRGRRTLAIAMTGFAGRQDREMALRAGFDEHVAKPIELDVLLERVRVLEASREERPGLAHRSRPSRA